jgi:monoterpene epsilon-lactone hydrolase
MISQEMRKFLAGINAQGAQKTASKGKMSTAEERANLDAFMAPLKIPAQIVLEDFVLAGRPARKCAPPEASDYVVLFFHGGGYRVGSLNGYNSFMAHLALACGIPVYGLDYRLVPEYTYPAALDDAVSAFMELSRNIASERILLVGDSAGGGLALACMLTLKERGLAVGGAAALLSPWLDGTASGESYGERRAEFQNAMKSYAGGFPLDTVGVSPLFGDHKGLPPLLLQVAEDEPLRDDSIQLHKRALAAGVDSRIEVFDNAFHDFQVFTQLPEALAAIDKIAAFFRETVL